MNDITAALTLKLGDKTFQKDAVIPATASFADREEILDELVSGLRARLEVELGLCEYHSLLPDGTPNPRDKPLFEWTGRAGGGMAS